jgi:membrane protease YdiL (CAAX protease family)
VPLELTRARAIAEVITCSGYPTQLLIVAGLSALGISPSVGGELSPRFIFAVSAIDTVLVLGLVFMFLRASHERPGDVFLGQRRVMPELGVGVMTIPGILVVVIGIQVVIRVLMPDLHNVPVNPFASLLASRWLLAGFIVLVLVAGALREEIQRAFVLHRFDQKLGGPWLGLALASIAFGLGHTVQGWDAAIITALLGASWGAIYILRRSVVSTMTSHAVFNVLQVLAGYAMLTPA